NNMSSTAFEKFWSFSKCCLGQGMTGMEKKLHNEWNDKIKDFIRENFYLENEAKDLKGPLAPFSFKPSIPHPEASNLMAKPTSIDVPSVSSLPEGVSCLYDPISEVTSLDVSIPPPELPPTVGPPPTFLPIRILHSSVPRPTVPSLAVPLPNQIVPKPFVRVPSVSILPPDVPDLSVPPPGVPYFSGPPSNPKFLNPRSSTPIARVPPLGLPSTSQNSKTAGVVFPTSKSSEIISHHHAEGDQLDFVKRKVCLEHIPN
ncbi:unnamed protein product, partial [Meganyctiphanes norvegica]